MLLYIGTHDPAWGHTWVTRGFGKVYALRSLAGGSALCVFDEASMAPFGEYPTPGEHSCHITLLDRRAVVADYTSGTLSLYSLDPNGLPTSSPAPSSLPALTGNPRLLRFEGSGPVPVRQESPHVHSSWLAPDGRSILVVDLGSDALYRFQVAEGQLVPESRERFAAPAGSGPRHCCFGRGVLYVATELSDEVLVYSWPEMVLLQRCVTNPERPGGGDTSSSVPTDDSSTCPPGCGTTVSPYSRSGKTASLLRHPMPRPPGTPGISAFLRMAALSSSPAGTMTGSNCSTVRPTTAP